MMSIKMCASCGAELPTDAPAGHCPNCLLRLASPSVLDDETIFSGQESDATDGIQAEPIRLFADYELLEEIARGGMGVVYKARQRSLDRIVAVKMIVSGQFASREYVQRFRAEASAAAILQHPNIVAIHEVGVHEGQHFFSMDYVQGRTLGEIVREGPLLPRRAATYLKGIAEAIHYAHGRGILHRDLKPSNVLIDAQDQPRITDFGLAKRLHGSSELTVTGQMLGSPNYMPPEQAGLGSSRREEALAEGPNADCGTRNENQSLVTSAATKMKVGPASDVYGLGAILYHLLTGRPPFQGETMEQVLMQLREQEPVALRLLNPSIPRDLETICLKCLEKDSTRRYPTARALSEELECFLTGTPIRARRVNAPEKLWRWCLRKPALASAFAVIASSFILGVSGIVWQSAGRKKALVQTQQALAEARRTLYAAEMGLVQQAWNDGAIDHAQALLRAHIPKPGEEDLRGIEWRHLWGLCRDESAITITNDLSMDAQSVAVSPDGTTIAFGGAWDLLRAWRFDTQRFLPNFKESSGWVRSVVFLPDSSRIACGYADKAIRTWNLSRGQVEATFENLTGIIERVRVSRDGRWLGAAEKPTGTIRLFDLERRREVQAIAGPPNRRPSLAFSPDGKTLAFGRSDQTVVLWDLERMTEVTRLSGAGFTVDLDFSPDGQWLAGAGGDSFIRLWNVLSEGEPVVLRGHIYVSSVSFSPNGAQLATSFMDGIIKLWDVASRSELRTLRGHKNWVNNIVFSPDGSRLISASDDKTVKLWNLGTSERAAGVTAAIDTMKTGAVPFHCFSSIFSPDGKLLVTASGDKILVWDSASERNVATLSGHTARVTDVAFSPDGRQLASCSEDATVRLWNVREQREVAVFKEETAGHAVAFSSDGRLLASGGADGTIRLYDLAARTLVTSFPGHREAVVHLIFTPDGRTLLSGSANNIYGWQIDRREPVFESENNSALWYLAVSPDGATTTLSATNDQNAVVWDLKNGRPRAVLIGHRRSIHHATYSGDGRLIATACADDTIKLWAASTGELLHTLTGHTGWVVYMAFSPDNRTLASSSADGTVRLWSLVSYKQVAALRPIGPFTSVTFSSDGRVLATRAAEDGRIRLWHAPTFEEIEKEMAQDTEPREALISKP